MGRRKFKLGRIHKNYERKRQLDGKNSIGRPSKQSKGSAESKNLKTELQSIQRGISLPTGWSIKNDHQSLSICKITHLPSTSIAKQPLSLSHCLNISEDLTWKLYVRGQRVDVSLCTALQEVPAKLELESANTLVRTVDSFKVCVGNPDQHFARLCDAHKGRILSPDGSVSAFTDDYCAMEFEGNVFESTVRASKCDLLLASGSRCDSCRKYRAVLRAMHSRQSTSTPRSERTEVSSHVNYRYLTTPEKAMRMTNLKAEVNQQKRKIESLQQKVKKLTEAEGVEVDDQMHDDLCNIMDEMTSQVEEQFPQPSFERVFWSQQLEARRVKDRRQIRWHPAMIKWCLNLKLLSSSAYHSLKTSGILVLPSERTLRDYTHWMKSDAGFSDSVDEQLLKEAKIDSSVIPWEFQRHVCLVFDEVKIKEDLVYDKHSCQIIGFVNLGHVNNQLLELERSEKGEPEESIAKNIVMFMVRGLFSKLEFPYAQFPCASLSADLIYPLVWKCVKRLESLKLYVMALTADGASCNRKFFRMHGPKDVDPETPTYKAVNVYNSKKPPIFFISDVPHLVKTVRNCWSNSFGHSRTRELEINGQRISWQHLVDLYHRHRGNGMAPTSGVSIVQKIKLEHIKLTSYSKMRVDLAAQVLSTTVAEAFKYSGDPEVKETARFCSMFDKFFDCLNVRSMDECVLKRKPDRRPYKYEDDSRLKWLEDDFLAYLAEWDRSAESRTDLEKSQRNRLCLSRETLEGLRMTVHSFVELTKYLLQQPGVFYFLSEKLCQDPLESFFGKQRMRGGYCNDPSAQSFLKNTVSLRLQGSMALKPRRGNTRREGDEAGKWNHLIDDAPLPKRPRRGSKKLF